MASNKNHPPSFTSSFPRASDADSEWIDSFCRAFASQCRGLHMESPKKNSEAPLTGCPSLESLPWPASKRIFFHLQTEECIDLANFAKASTHFNTGVNEFLRNNPPGIRNVIIVNPAGYISMEFHLYRTNIPFYGLSNVDSGRFKRFGDSDSPRLQVTLKDSDDSIKEQVTSMLSTSINHAAICGYNFTPDDFSLCVHLLRNSTIVKLDIIITVLNHTSAPFILSMTSHAKEIKVQCDATQLSDPDKPYFLLNFILLEFNYAFINFCSSHSNICFSEAFIIQLLSSHVSYSRLFDLSSSTSFFVGLPHSFWKKFLNERLANGTFEYIETGNMEGKITKAPFDLPDTPIEWLEWLKKK